MTADDDRWDLYIHVPFCHAKCIYCDFCSAPIKLEENAARYAGRAIEEMRARVKECQLSPTTVYIGGGTPSILPIPELQRIVDAIDLSRCREFTIEANPEDVTPEWARAIADMGITRVSMGLQTMDDGQLAAIGRRHSAEQSIEAYQALRHAGIDNISLDLIYGLPGQTLDSWRMSLQSVLAMRPEHLSCYLLSYEPRTRLTALRDAGTIAEATEELCRKMYDLLCDEAAHAGYEHYEISNFALPGRRSCHNSSYWDGTPYIGIGPGAHSLCPDGMRRFNAPRIMEYLSRGYQATLADDPETLDNRINDTIITALRTRQGLSISRFSQLYGRAEARDLLARARKAIAAGQLSLSGDILAIPECEWLMTDAILVDLIV